MMMMMMISRSLRVDFFAFSPLSSSFFPPQFSVLLGLLHLILPADDQGLLVHAALLRVPHVRALDAEQLHQEQAVHGLDGDAQRGAGQNVPRIVLVIAHAAQRREHGEHQPRELHERDQQRPRRPLPLHQSRLQIQGHEGHGLEGRARVSREETEPRVVDPIFSLLRIVEQKLISFAGEIGHVNGVTLVVGAFDPRPVGLANVDEMRPQPPDGVLGRVGHQLARGRAEQVHQQVDVDPHQIIRDSHGFGSDVEGLFPLQIPLLANPADEEGLHDDDGQRRGREAHEEQHHRRDRGVVVGMSDGRIVAEETPLKGLRFDEVQHETGQSQAYDDEKIGDAARGFEVLVLFGHGERRRRRLRFFGSCGGGVEVVQRGQTGQMYE